MSIKEELERLLIQVHDARDGHYYDADECWYCGFRDGIEAAIVSLLTPESKIYVKDKRVHSNITIDRIFKLYMELKDKYNM